MMQLMNPYHKEYICNSRNEEEFVVVNNVIDRLRAHLQVTVCVYQEIARLKIAMKDIRGVECFERPKCL